MISGLLAPSDKQASDDFHDSGGGHLRQVIQPTSTNGRQSLAQMFWPNGRQPGNKPAAICDKH
jgi:hypothetical protein